MHMKEATRMILLRQMVKVMRAIMPKPENGTCRRRGDEALVARPCGAAMQAGWHGGLL